MPTADALPYIDDAVVDRSVAEAALGVADDQLRRRVIGIVDVIVGPGFGRAWVGESGGDYAVADIDDFSLVAVLESARACPDGGDLYMTVNDVPVFFVAIPDR